MKLGKKQVTGLYLGSKNAGLGYLNTAPVIDFIPPTPVTASYDNQEYYYVLENGRFEEGMFKWSNSGGWSVNNGYAVYDGNYGQSRIYQLIDMVQGGNYFIGIEVVSNEGGGDNYVKIGNVFLLTKHADVGLYQNRFTWTQPSGKYNFEIYGNWSEIFIIDNIFIEIEK